MCIAFIATDDNLESGSKMQNVAKCSQNAKNYLLIAIKHCDRSSERGFTESGKCKKYEFRACTLYVAVLHCNQCGKGLWELELSM